MKTIKQITLIALTGILISACSSTQETVAPENKITSAQINQWQDQQRAQENAQRMGLDQEEVKQLNIYAEKKARLECKLKDLDKAASEALSDEAGMEIKQSIIALDQELIALGKEIDLYCKDDPERTKYFYQIHKQYMLNCK